MDPVWQALVYTLPILGGHKRSHDQVYVAEEEKDDHGEGCLEGRIPVSCRPVAVQVNQPARDKRVDDGQRVRNEVEHKVVRVARWGGQNRNRRDEPVLKEAGKRGVEGAVARPEAREGKDSLAPEFLDQPALGEDDAQDVAKRRQCNKDGQGPLGRLSKHVAEERGRHQALRFQHLLFRHGRKVGHVCEHVQDGNGAEGQRGGELERPGRVLGLAEGVVGVAVTDKAPNDVVQRRDDAVRTAGRALERLGESVVLPHLFEIDQRGYDDDDNDQDLQNTQEILQSDSPFQRRAVDQEGSRQTCQRDASLVPPRHIDLRGVQDVLAKDDRVARRPPEEDHVASVQRRGEELGLAVHEFEVILLTAVAGQSRAKLHVDCCSGGGDEHAHKPDYERQARGATLGKNGCRRGKDAGTDDAVEDEQGGRGNAYLTFVFAGDFELAYFGSMTVSLV